MVSYVLATTFLSMPMQDLMHRIPDLLRDVALARERILYENVEWFRQNASAIFSDFHLFEDYLGFDRPDLDAQVRRYLDGLQISHKVSVHNGRLSTIDLSQGQRKRLALLTALLEDRPIYGHEESFTLASFRSHMQV